MNSIILTHPHNNNRVTKNKAVKKSSTQCVVTHASQICGASRQKQLFCLGAPQLSSIKTIPSENIV